MKLYVVSTQYLTLVNVNLRQEIPVTPKEISAQDLEIVFNKSDETPMIACERLEDAFFIAKTQLKIHCTNPIYVEDDTVKHFATPVIYTMYIEGSLPNETVLTSHDLTHYMNKTTIPLYPYDNDDKTIVSEQSQMALYLGLKPELKMRKLNELAFANVREASYFNPAGELILNNLSDEPLKAPTSVRPKTASFRVTHFAPKTHQKVTVIGQQPLTEPSEQSAFTLV